MEEGDTRRVEKESEATLPFLPDVISFVMPLLPDMVPLRKPA